MAFTEFDITAKSLEEFVLKKHGLQSPQNPDRGAVGWYYQDKALCYYNTGFEAVYTTPDWDNLAKKIIDNYDWIETEDDLYEAFDDAVSVYRLFSRG